MINNPLKQFRLKAKVSNLAHGTMNPGEVVFFNEGTFHGSEANTSDIPRVALSIRYTTPEVRFLTDQWSDAGRIKTFLLRGEDTHHLNDAIRGAPPAY